MNDRKTRFYIRVAQSVLNELKARAKQQRVAAQDLARYALERGLSVMALEEARADLIEAAKHLITAAAPNRKTGDLLQNGTANAALKSLFFIEQYLRNLALKEPDAVGIADRISNRKLKEFIS